MFEYDYSGKLALINLFIWVILILLYNSQFFNYNPKEKRAHIFILLVTLFTTLGFSEADTYHYHSIYDEMVQYRTPIHIEDFYYWLIEVLPKSYYLWRFVIWTSALWLLMKSFKRLGLDFAGICFVFPMLLLQQFTITRGCLGIALFMYSFSLISFPNRNRLMSYVLGVVGIIGSLFLHRSMPIFISVFLISLIPFNKYTIIAILLALPIARTVVMPFVTDLLENILIDSETSDFAALYLEGSKSEITVKGMIRQVIDYAPRVALFYILIKDYYWKGRPIKGPIKILLQYSIVLFVLAVLFLGQETSSFVTNRTIHMMCFPLTCVLAYYLMQENRHTLLMKLTMFGFLLSDFYAFAYTIYKTW